MVPAGWHTVTPRIVARRSQQLVAFLKKVFNAKGRYRLERPSEIAIGDSIVMISEAGARVRRPLFSTSTSAMSIGLTGAPLPPRRARCCGRLAELDNPA